MSLSWEEVSFGRPEFRQAELVSPEGEVKLVDMVDLKMKGQQESTAYRIADLKGREAKVITVPRDGDTEKRKKQVLKSKEPAPFWNLIEPLYEAWKKGHSLDIDGTSVDTVPFIPSSLAKMLKAQGMPTVEQFATAAESALGAIRFPNVRGVQSKAKEWVENRKTVDQAKEELSAELEELRSRLAEAEKPEAEKRKTLTVKK